MPDAAVIAEAPRKVIGRPFTSETAPRHPEGRTGRPNVVNQVVREAFEDALAGRIDLVQWYVDVFTARDAQTMAVAARVLSIFGPPRQLNVSVGVRLEDVLADAHERRVARLAAADEKRRVIDAVPVEAQP